METIAYKNFIDEVRIEKQVFNPFEGCDIIVFGDKYQFKQIEYKED